MRKYKILCISIHYDVDKIKKQVWKQIANPCSQSCNRYPFWLFYKVIARAPRKEKPHRLARLLLQV